MGALWIFDNTPPCFDRAPPTLGQHSREILAEAGFSAADIASMLAQGLVVETVKVVLK
jgi:crotonobetainyl-CoA:carnitine CoA-transferase CaiB-like acyl-CoA transferase